MPSVNANCMKCVANIILFATNGILGEKFIAPHHQLLKLKIYRPSKRFRVKMATGPAVSSVLETISRHHLECPICSKKYQRPKILDCQHSFCEQCLLTYCSTKHQGCTEIPCPLCRQETQLPEAGVRGLKTNFDLISLVEEIELQEKLVGSGETKLLCETCDDGNEATHRCLDCEQNICSHCRNTQLRITATSSHNIPQLEEIRQGKMSMKTKSEKHCPTCPTHEGEVTRFFCTTCEALICRDCTVINHCKPEHIYLETKKAVLTYKQLLADLFSPIEETMNELQKSKETVSKMRNDLDIKVERAVAEVQYRAAEIRAEVTAQENRTIDKIKTIQSDRHQKLAEHEKTMSLASERTQHTLETAREVTRTAADSEFLSLYATINKDLRLLAGETIPRVDKRLGVLEFRPSEGVGDISLGRLVTEGKWKQRCKFGRSGSGPGEFNWAQDIVARRPDEVAVADCYNKRVVICSIDGNQKSTIPMEGCPRAIAATRSDNLLVVVEENASHVKVFDEDNTLVFQFPTVSPDEMGETKVNLQSVAVKTDGTIVVGDPKRMVLTEHSPTDGELRSTIPVNIKPCYLAVDSNDRVVITDSTRDSSLPMGVVDGNGDTLFTIKPIISGQKVQYCNGVCTDSSGYYVGVDNGAGTGHIHQYDHQGGFLHCIAQTLYDPRGIILTADRQLAVADKSKVKVYHED